MLNTFRLGTHPSSYYLDLFDEHGIKLKNTGYPERFFKFPHAVLTIGNDDDDRQFDIIFIAENDTVEADSIVAAKEVLAQIVEMDDAARALDPYIQDGKALDHDEVLARVEILREEIRFGYFATTLNTEWDVAFDRNASGKWVCLGIANP